MLILSRTARGFGPALTAHESAVVRTVPDAELGLICAELNLSLLRTEFDSFSGRSVSRDAPINLQGEATNEQNSVMRRSGWAACRIILHRFCKGTWWRATFWRSFFHLSGTAIQVRRSYWRISRSVRLLAGANVRRKWWTNYRSSGRIGLRSRLPEITMGTVVE